MLKERRVSFPPFALDLVNECLWRGSEPIKLRPKAFAVLEHLLARPGQLVTKEHLIGAVWQDTFVGDGVLKVAIRQIRDALSDDPRSPRFIETAHRRGYRFIGEVAATLPTGTVPARGYAEAAAGPVLRRPDTPAGFVGRDPALARMHEWFERMRGGERQILFVTGEAGIGKTTLLDTFTRSIAADRSVRICRGQCLEQYGMSEAYLPFLDAITQLCGVDAQVVDVLRAHAPMWLLQMPSLVTPSDRESFGREVLGATRERMLREMGAALDALSAHQPLVLVLEDLHWSDFSTLDLISYVARRREAAHLMVLATYRPAELIATGHPLKAVKQELLARQQCEELPLEYLTEAAIAQHLGLRFPANRFPPGLGTVIHERTEGNPLFMVNTIDYLVAAGMIEPHGDGWRMTAALEQVKVGVPDSIRQLIEAQIDRVDAADQRILEAASVAGAEFAVRAVSAALSEEAGDVDMRCQALSRRHLFISERGAQVLPNGEVAGRYGFVHALYRHVMYERVSASRRMLLHRRIAERGEELYGERSGEIAAELAMHFERAANYAQAARYLQQAATNAMRRSAFREAIALAHRGLELLATLPDTEERARQELWLQLTLGVPLIATEGYAAADVGRVYVKARALCERLGVPPEISQVLWGLWTFHALKAELSTALAIASEFLRLAERGSGSGMAMRGHWTMEITCTHQGEFVLALEHYDKAIALFQPDQYRDAPFSDALNPGVALRCFAAWSSWFVGRPDRALVQIQEAVALAGTLSEPHGLAHALAFAAIVHQLRREPDMAQQHAEAAINLSTEHGLVLYQAMGRVLHGWARSGPENEGDAVAEIRQGIADWEGTGAQLMRPHYLALLSEALVAPGDNDEALRNLELALAAAEFTGERCYLAELYRLKGERLLLRGHGASGEAAALACFEAAAVIARQQQARSLELRAAMSLARVHRRRGRQDLASGLLTPIVEMFVEGLDTVDLREARALTVHP